MIEHYWKWDFSQHYWSIRQVGVVAALCYSGIFTTNILYCIYTTHVVPSTITQFTLSAVWSLLFVICSTLVLEGLIWMQYCSVAMHHFSDLWSKCSFHHYNVAWCIPSRRLYLNMMGETNWLHCNKWIYWPDLPGDLGNILTSLQCCNLQLLQFANYFVAVPQLGGRSEVVMDGVPRRIHRDIVSELNQFRARADSGDTDITDNQGFTILTSMCILFTIFGEDL